MNHRRPGTSWSERLPGRRPEQHFRWRGQEVSRLEGFSDTVFAFAVTLLIVALEVPRDFAGLTEVLRGFPAFVASFAILMTFWGAHYRFFRRYGLEDGRTRLINYAILLLVLFASYPLKFLFSALFDSVLGNQVHATLISNREQLITVFRTYGAGLALTWLLYGLLYAHAYRLRIELQLNAVERQLTLADLGGIAVYLVVGMLSVLLTFLPVSPLLAGFVYFLIGPGMIANYRWHRRRVNAILQGQSEITSRARP